MTRLALAGGLGAALVLTACSKKAEPPPAPPPRPVAAVPEAIDAGLAGRPAPLPPPPSPPPVLEPGPSTDPRRWVAHADQGVAQLSQEPLPRGKCTVRCATQAGGEVWSTTTACFVDPTALRFVSADCERSVLLIPSPSRKESWRNAVVMRVFSREKLEFTVKGLGFEPDERKVRGATSWIAGCLGVAGQPPRYSAAGDAVEFETVSGKHHSIPLKPTEE